MKKKTASSLFLVALMGIFAISILSGCQEGNVVSDEEKIPEGPFFYPSPPDFPKIQFLKSFSGPDTGEKKVSGFEHFIVGDEDQDTTALRKPYGFALHDNKFYICDVGAKGVMILDIDTGEFKPMNRDSRMARPGTIWIESGIKYIADAEAGAIFVYGNNDKLLAIWGREDGITPIDIVVLGDYLYVLDSSTSQVVLLDKKTGKEVKRIGERGDQQGQLQYVTGLAVDDDGNVYISDKINAIVTKLNSESVYQQTFSFRSLSIHGLTRPKGLDIDNEGRLWIVDSETNVAKIFNKEGQLLLYFSQRGFWPGDLYLPASIRIDYDHIAAFQKYAVPGAQLECLIIISNQYGPHKISVYGLGKFPVEEALILQIQQDAVKKDKELSEGLIGDEQPDDKPE